MIETIPRMQVELCNEEMSEFAAKCKQVLKYDVLMKQGHRPLLRQLLVLDITPLDQKAVEKYKRAKLGWWLRFNDWAWNVVRLHEYALPIPEFVLHKALQIKEAAPSCGIWVDSVVLKPDPFLVVSATDGRPSHQEARNFDCEYYYIEVWDEPKFEGRITK